MSSRYALWSLFSPSQLIVAILVLGVVLMLAGRFRVGRWLAVAGAVGMLVGGVLPTAAWLAAALESRFPRPELPARVDGIIQLAGAERVAASAHFGAPELREGAGRYFTTLQLARRFPTALVVHSGNGADRPQEAAYGGETAIARQLFITSGVHETRLRFEDRSTDTCQSAHRSFELLRPAVDQHWVLVTSALHMPRAVACFRAAGWQIIPYPADHRAQPGGIDAGTFRVAANLVLLDAALHEWLGLAWYRLGGRTTEWFPRPV